MADQVEQLKASLLQSQQQLAARFQTFSGESLSRAGQATTQTSQSLDLLRNVFNANLGTTETARMDLQAINTLLSRQIGSAGVGFSRFTNPIARSSLSAGRQTTGRQSTIKASTKGTQQTSRRSLGQGTRV